MSVLSWLQWDKLLRLTTTYPAWDDIRIVPSSFDRPGTTDPTIQDWQPGGSGTVFKVWCFNKGQAGFFTCQLPHSYKIGSDLYAHVRWTPHSRGTTEATATVAWKLDYSIIGIGGIFLASGTLDLSDSCQGTNHQHLMSPDVLLPGSGVATISAMLVGKLYRDSTGDTWSGTNANGPALLELDFHYEMDAVGSTTKSTK